MRGQEGVAAALAVFRKELQFPERIIKLFGLASGGEDLGGATSEKKIFVFKGLFFVRYTERIYFSMRSFARGFSTQVQSYLAGWEKYAEAPSLRGRS